MKRLFKAQLHPTLGWGAALIAVLGAMILPALLGAPFVMKFPDIAPDASQATTNFKWFLWYVGASLTVTPLFFPVILVLATPAVWLLLRGGWTGYLSLILVSWIVGLPAAHVTLHGDMTTEAPQMMIVIMSALALQAVVCGVILRLLSRWKRAKSVQSAPKTALSPPK